VEHHPSRLSLLSSLHCLSVVAVPRRSPVSMQSSSPDLIGTRTQQSTGGCNNCRVIVHIPAPIRSDSEPFEAGDLGAVFLYEPCSEHSHIDVASLFIKSRRKTPSAWLSTMLRGYAPHRWNTGNEFNVDSATRTVKGQHVNTNAGPPHRSHA
jgi:hypothetical protein